MEHSDIVIEMVHHSTPVTSSNHGPLEHNGSNISDGDSASPARNHHVHYSTDITHSDMIRKSADTTGFVVPPPLLDASNQMASIGRSQTSMEQVAAGIVKDVSSTRSTRGSETNLSKYDC